MTLLIATESAEQLQALEQLFQGHTVLCAHNVAQIENVANSQNEVEALLCDHSFKEADGSAIAEALRKRFPELRVGFITESGAGVNAQGDTLFGPETTSAELLSWLGPVSEPTTPLEAASTAEPTPPTRPTSVVADAVGLSFGDYDIIEKRRDMEWTESYLAYQKSMGRHVVLERLKPTDDAEERQKEFKSMARAKAAISHPAIAAVFEAQQTSTGEIFLTRELIKGKHLTQLAQNGQKYNSPVLLRVLQTTGETMAYYGERGLPREPLRADHVYIGTDNTPRLANLGVAQNPAGLREHEEMARIADAIHRVADYTQGGGELKSLLQRMHGKGLPLRNWRALADATRQSMLKVSSNGIKSGGFRAGLSPLLLGTLVAVPAVALGIIFLKPSSTKKPPPPPPKSPVVEEMLKVEAGAITLKDGASAQVGTFYMDKHEVTVRQYAEFVRADTLKFDHAKQPASKTSHKPAHWDEFYAAAKEGGLFRGARLTLDSPMSFVDWWDAYAYAAWRGRRLPTLNEWLLAATGDGTRPYPWGTQEDPQNANTSKDYPPKAEPNVAPGSVDGHAHWAEVDAMKKDVTPQGILGLAGNVSEWVSDWGQNPDLPDEQSPMFCGGNFALPLAPLQDQRYPTKKLIYAELNVGLRTVSDTPPKP